LADPRAYLAAWPIITGSRQLDLTGGQTYRRSARHCHAG